MHSWAATARSLPCNAVSASPSTGGVDGRGGGTLPEGGAESRSGGSEA